MLIQFLRKPSKLKRLVVGVMVLTMLPLTAWSGAPSAPTDRWIKANGSVLSNLPATAVPVTIDDELPDLTPDVKVGTVIVSSNGTTMTVKQATDRALIDWDTFNIGRNNTVSFQQPGADSVALNRIHQQSPSKIFGRLDANGNVWLFNPNGVFFGRESQVNVRGMIASSMEFNGLDETNFDTADLFGAINQGKPFLANARLLAEGSTYCAGVDCSIALDSNPASSICTGAQCNDDSVQSIIQGGENVSCTGTDCRQLLPRIIIERGARVATLPGGQLLMAAPEVINEGSLEAGEGGQAILAGSRKDLYLAVTNDTDTDLRGFIVEVDSGAANPTGGAVVNAGDITANLGNVTLVAKEIVQAGQLRSSTAIDVNGTIRLISRDGGNVVSAASNRNGNTAYPYYLDNEEELPDAQFDALGKNPGAVILQEGSSIRIAIDNSKGTANDSLDQATSRVHIEGKQVYMGAGAEIVAPGGQVTVRAHTDPANLAQSLSPDSSFIMDDDARIDVSGTTDTVVGAERNTLEFFITSNELKDSPQQKSGALLRKTVKVDIRRGTPLFDWTQGLATVEKSASERNAAGGTIDIKAGAVSLGDGTVLDVSGGYVTYEGGMVESSKLLGNKIADIADADIDTPYMGVSLGNVVAVVDPKWGVRPSYRPGSTTNQYYRDAYQHGDDAGSLRILSGQQWFDPGAQFNASITTGPYQRAAVTAPAGGVLAFDAGVSASDVYIHNALGDFGATWADNEIRLLAGQLQSSGANKVLINTSGVVNLGTQQNPLYLSMGLGQSDAVGGIADTYSGLASDDFVVSAGGIYQFGELRTPSANIAFNQRDIVANNGRAGDGVLQINGLIDTSGQWTNDMLVGLVPTSQLRTDGGSVSLQSEEALEVASQAFIKTDAGAWLDKRAKLSIGTAGDISLRNSGLENNGVSSKQAVVDVRGRFSALDGGKGGVLTVEAENFDIGGSGPTTFSNQATVGNAFFDQTDVGGYRFVAANGSVVVNGNADIDLSHKVLVNPAENSVTGVVSQTGVPLNLVASKDSAASVLKRVDWQGADLFRAPAGSLRLDANRPTILAADDQKGIVELQAGSRIVGTPGSTVSVNSTNRSLLDGLIEIAGGTVSAKNTTIGNGSEQEDADLFTYLLVGANAHIDLSAKAIADPSDPHFDNYVLVDGGSVNLTGEVGSVIVDPEAEILLRGATVQPRSARLVGGLTPGGRGTTLVNSQTPPLLRMKAGSFNLIAEKGFALGSVVDFGQPVAANNSAGYAGGSLNLSLTYFTGRQNSTNQLTQPTLGELEIALGETSGFSALSGFAFGDALPMGYISGSTNINGRTYVTGKGMGFVAAGNLSDNHVDALTINTQNSTCCDFGGVSKTALSQVSVTGDVALSANSSVVLDAGWLNVSDGSSLSVVAPYARLGESTNAKTFSGLTVDNAIEQLLPTSATDLKAGTGSVVLSSDFLDLIGNLAITGTNSVSLSASEATRLRSVANIYNNGNSDLPSPMANRLDVFGDTTFNTPVIYASTLSDYTINRLDSGPVVLNGYFDPVTGQRRAIRESVLSYGGRVGINADQISVDTAVVAPFGNIDISASDSLAVQSGAYLGVSALDDTRIPFGRTQGGLTWIYSVAGSGAPMRFSADGIEGTRSLPEKVINLSGKTIDAESGSKIDLAGGGEVYSTEFIAGLGGSSDILRDVPFSQRFVLVKCLQSGFAPFDFSGSRNSQIAFGTTLEVSGSANLPDGTYTVLPASYAFLQNAYLVTPETVSNTVAPGYKDRTFYGAEIVAGRFGNSTGSAKSNWQAFRIDQGFRVGADGSITDPRAEYAYNSLDQFFEAGAPGILPSENGRLAIDIIGNFGDQLSLLLASSILSSSNSRIGSSVDINSNQSIAVTSSQTPVPGTLLIDPQLLVGTGADSVLIGGSRNWSNAQQAWQVTTSANDVLVDGVAVGGKELMLTAKSGIQLNNNASISTTGNVNFVGNRWVADDNASTLLSSSSKQSRLLHTAGVKNYGGIDTSGGSVTSTGTLAAAYDGSNPLSNISVNQARLQVFSDTITLGSGAGVTLDQSVLQSASILELGAESLLQVATAISISNLDEAILRTPLIDVADGASFDVTANDRISLQMLASATSLTKTASSVVIKAPEVVLESATGQAASMTISSGDVRVEADTAVTTIGDVNLHSEGDLTIDTPLIVSQATGTAEFSAANTLQLTTSAAGTATAPANYAAGNIFRFAADDLVLDTTIWAPAGVIIGRATSSLETGANADLVVPAIRVTYPDGDIISQEGAISLVSGGAMTVADVNAFNFGADGDNSNGGLLELLAAGALSIGLPATSAGGDSGRDLSLQADSLDVSALLWLNQNGFDRDISAITTGIAGDLAFASGDVLSARDLKLVAANADLEVGSGASILVGGNRNVATLYAGNQLTIADTAGLTVSAVNDEGGDLSLQSPGGEITVDQGATINVAGDLEVVADFNASATDVQLDASDSIAGQLVLYLAHTFNDASLTVSDFFSSGTSAIEQALADTANAVTSHFINVLPDAVRPLIDIASSGDMSILEAIDLAGLRSNGEPGRLVLRSAGDIDVLGSLSDGVGVYDTSAFGLSSSPLILLNDQSWDFELAAGAIDAEGLAIADLTSSVDKGITLADGSFIRTGTGNISLASTGDITLGTANNQKAYIATVGRADYESDPFMAFADAPGWNGEYYLNLWYAIADFSGFSLDSGDINISSGGDLKGFAASGLTTSNFIHSITADSLEVTGYADYSMRRIRALALSDMEVGVHAIGGGSIYANARGDIDRIGFSTPGVASGVVNDGRLVYSVATPGGAVSTLGGRLSVESMGDISHSAFANDGASIDISARGAISQNASSSTGVFLSGSYSDISLVAGGDIQLEGIGNTTVMPYSTGQALNPLIGLVKDNAGNAQSVRDVVGWFFSGYDSTHLAVTSVAGDVRFTGNYQAISDLLGPRLSGSLSQSSNELRFSLLPPDFQVNALGGDFISESNLTMFPDPGMNLALRAHGSIRPDLSRAGDNDEIFIYLPDFNADLLPTDLSFYSIPSAAATDFESGFEVYVNPNYRTAAKQFVDPRTSLSQRDETLSTKLYALTGSLGAQDETLFIDVVTPIKVDAYAGQNITNVNFEIQHSNASDISLIRAGGDFEYTLDYNNTGLIDGDGKQFIEVAGPGDLIVSAGGDIDLGASGGITAIGNSKFSFLPDAGASIHLFAGYSDSQKDFSRLIGDGVAGIGELSGLASLGLGATQLNSLTIDDWFLALAGSGNSYGAVVRESVSKATGRSYVSTQQAIADWNTLSDDMQLRTSVNAIKELALANPQILVAKGELLFNKKPLGSRGFASAQERQQTFADYWDGIAALIALDKMLSPNRVGEFTSQGPDLATFAAMPLDQQINTTVDTFGKLGHAQQLLVAESVLNHQLRQSGIEAANNGRTLAGFERGFVAMRRFYGTDLDAALVASALRTRDIQRGSDPSIRPGELLFGNSDSGSLGSFSDVLAFWERDSGDDFNIAEINRLLSVNTIDQLSPQERDNLAAKYGDDLSLTPQSFVNGDISLVFSSVRTSAPGASINFNVPAGEVDVGLSADLIRSLNVKIDTNTKQILTNELGVIVEFFGDINANVASAFNVNESRAFSLAGGAVNLWATWGDIDAGKGAKTAVTTPEARFVVSRNSGAITKVTPPSVSGSGIKTDERRLASSASLGGEQRFYQVASGAGPAYLATPLGVVDAGEAGIESAGNLFIAAQQVRGADNISVGGVSVGVATTSSVSANVASAGDSSSQAASSVTDSVAGAASDEASTVTAFVTIELLDTGIGLDSGPATSTSVCAAGEDC